MFNLKSLCQKSTKQNNQNKSNIRLKMLVKCSKLNRIINKIISSFLNNNCSNFSNYYKNKICM